MKIAVVILHYKNIGDTLECLKSVESLDKRDLEIKVILVSNTPGESLFNTPGVSKFHLGRASPKAMSAARGVPNVTLGPPSEVVIIQTPKNLGFAAGVNLGIKEALKDKTTDYILILNNDTILPRNLLKVLLKDRIDIVSPVIKFKSLEGKWVYDYGGRVNWWIGRTRHIESTNIHLGGVHSATFEVLPQIDYVSGCCILVRREVFEKIGLFDERYFFYFEDADFCLRAKKAGLKTEVNHQVVIFHKLGGGIGRWSNKAIFYNLLSNFIFISKHLGWKRPIGYLYLLVLTGKIIIDKILGG